MPGHVADHLRRNAYGLIAIFIAISGTAYAVDGSLPGQNTVGSLDIMNGEVASADLRNNQVTSEDVRDDALANGGLTSADIANRSLHGLDVEDGTLTGIDLANGGVTGTDISDQSVNSDDIFGVRGVDVEDGTLGSEDVRQEGLRGEDIDEGTLRFGCRAGMVRGFALVKGSDAMPSEAFTTDPAHITSTYNCSGGAVEVKHGDGSGGGLYDVRFPGARPQVAEVTPFDNATDLDNFIAAAVSSATDTVRVTAADHDDGFDRYVRENTWFYITVY